MNLEIVVLGVDVGRGVEVKVSMEVGVLDGDGVSVAAATVADWSAAKVAATSVSTIPSIACRQAADRNANKSSVTKIRVLTGCPFKLIIAAQ